MCLTNFYLFHTICTIKFLKGGGGIAWGGCVGGGKLVTCVGLTGEPRFPKKLKGKRGTFWA